MKGLFKVIIDTDNGNISSDLKKGDLVMSKTTDGKNCHTNRAVVYKVENESVYLIPCEEGDYTKAKLWVRVGSISDDKRQSFIIQDSEGKGAPNITLYSGVNNWKKFGSANTQKVVIGKLDDIIDKDFGALKGDGFRTTNGYLSNVFVKGEIQVQGNSNVYNKDETDAKIKQIGSIDEAMKVNNDDIAKSVGYADYASLISASKNKNTIIKGGYINTSLINADAIVAKGISADKINALTLNCNKGKLGGFNVDDKYLWTGNKQISNSFTSSGITIGNNAIRSKNFRIDDNGSVYLKGNIDATSGKFGKWIIAGDRLISQNGQTVLYENGDIELIDTSLGRRTLITNDKLPNVNTNSGLILKTSGETNPTSVSSIQLPFNDKDYAIKTIYPSGSSYTDSHSSATKFTLDKGKNHSIHIGSSSAFNLSYIKSDFCNLWGYIKISLMSMGNVLTSKIIDYANKGSYNELCPLYVDGNTRLFTTPSCLTYTPTNTKTGCYIKIDYYIKGYAFNIAFGSQTDDSFKTVSYKPYGLPLSLYIGDMSSVISPNGMRVFANGGNYFEINSEANSPRDFVKMVWAGKDYGLV
jgi:hypothetical protein